MKNKGLKEYNWSLKRCLDIVMVHEGGYSFNPNDPGGETNFGICKKSYPDIDIKNLTDDKARAIYEVDFWNKIYAKYLPERLHLIYLDAAINHGRKTAILLMQKSLNIPADGIAGPVTKGKFKTVEPQEETRILLDYAEKRMLLYASLLHFKNFKNGWIRRLFFILNHTL